MTSKQIPSRPLFDALPLDKSGPPGNAWGLYGADDQLGALNLLTPETVVAAAQEIKTGERISLDWHLNKPSRPSFDRPPFEVKLRNSHGRTINDDELHFNTQCSTQWDGFRHFGYQGAKRFYGNRTQDDVEKTGVLGIDVWAENGGIVGRGVLLDYVSFCHRHSITFEPMTSTSIPLEHIEQMVREQNVSFQSGDILVLRVGFTAVYNTLDAAGQVALAQRPTPDFLGVEPTAAMLRWLWESGFAAVVSDSPSFEQAPVEGLWTSKELEDRVKDGGLLHQVLIGGWGMPIGEMFDLENLAETCQRLGRWTFFISSVPLKVPGGVASPPNAVAIF
ncbi:Major facilitator superfamily transporter [Pleurostoma richardsiae]|uniref:Major facilitator superfamily transporter n=1 Tax=Pleurostoma richardsiae TaxID=41990 RepID=A0AA38VC79_9PEZI|nr:Major facilitator superfamily transporter [Pleurostoma richardsiae]